MYLIINVFHYYTVGSLNGCIFFTLFYLLAKKDQQNKLEIDVLNLFKLNIILLMSIEKNCLNNN